MNSWVCASTPTVTRTSTSCTTPAAPAMASRRSISIIESSTTWPTPALTAAVSSSTDLLLPCSAIRSAREVGVQRDRELAAAADVERQALFVDPAGDLGAQERLGGVAHVVAAAEGRGDLAAARPEVVLVDDEHAGCRTRRRCRSTETPAIDTTPSSPRTALRGHTFGASASSVVRGLRALRRAARGGSPRRAADRRGARSHPLRCADAENAPARWR